MNMDSIEIEELDGEQREIAECIGIDGYRKLVGHFGGTSVYIQKCDKTVKNLRDEKIKSKFDGGNYKALAREFNLSESAVRKILNNVNSA